MAQVIRHPAFAHAQKLQKRREEARKRQEQARRELVRSLRIPTRELKVRIEMLTYSLLLPENHPAGVPTIERKRVEDRLRVYAEELLKRDEREAAQQAQPLSAEKLTQRFNRDLSAKFGTHRRAA